MFKKKIALLTLSMFPVFAYATDIIVVNNTDSFGTGKLNSSPCSSIIGDNGIAKPHGTLNVSSDIIRMFCGNSRCDAHIYASRDCSGNEIGTAIVQVDQGVLDVKNNDPYHYRVTGGGFKITIDQIHKSFTDWFKSLF